MAECIERSRSDFKIINLCIFLISVFAIFLFSMEPSLFKALEEDVLFCSIFIGHWFFPVAILAIFFQAWITYIEETKDIQPSYSFIFLVYTAFIKGIYDVWEKQKILLAGTAILIFLMYVFLLEFRQEGIIADGEVITLGILFITIPVTYLAAALQIIFWYRFSDYDDADISSSQTLDKSIGALWAVGAYESYYKIALESGENIGNFIVRCQAFEQETGKQICMKKLLIICPLSCNIQGSLKDKDENISAVGELKPIEYDQGANMNRNYKQTVYGIKDHEGRIIHVVAEFASPLGALWGRRKSMPAEKRKYHRDCFIKKLEDILYPYHYAVILKYDDQNPDSTEPLSRFLLTSVEKLLQDRNIVL